MKKQLAPLALYLVTYLLFSSQFVYSQSKTTIAVLDFEAKNVHPETAEAVADILSTELFNTNRFNVVERNSITSLLEEQKLQMTGVTDMSKAAEIGKVLNVEKIMIGSVSRLGETFIINTRLVDVETGALSLAQNTQSSNGESGLPDAIAILVKQISQKITVEGAIIKISGRVVLINIGKNAGVKPGQLLEIIRIGDVITDLGGTTIGRTEDYIGRLKVTSIKPEYAETALLDSKTSLRLGDKVRLMTTAADLSKKTIAPKKKQESDKEDKPVALPPVF